MALTTGKIAKDLLISQVHKLDDPKHEEKAGSTKTAASSSKKEGETPEGLPSDVREIERYKQMIASGMKLTAAQARDFQGKVASLKGRMRRYEAAEKKIEEKGSGSDIAINDRGYVYLRDKNGSILMKNIRAITESDRPHLMTLSQIKEEVYNGNSPFNEDLLNTMHNAVTSADAMSRARDEIKKMDYDSAGAESGSVSGQQTLEGFIKMKGLNKMQWKGIRDDRFKDMWQQMVDHLSEQDRNRLLLTGILRHGYVNGDSGSIFDAMYGVLKTDVDKSVVYDLNYNHFSGKNGKDNDPSWNKALTSNCIALAMAEEGADRSGATKTELQYGNVKATLDTFNAMHATNGGANEYREEGNLKNLVNGNSNKSDAYDTSNIFIGDKRLKTESMSKIAYKDRRFAFYPFKKDSNNRSVPDVDVFKDLDAVPAKLQAMGYKTDMMLNSVQDLANVQHIFESCGFDGNTHPKLIPDGLEEWVVGQKMSIQDMMDKYFNMSYNEKSSGGKFFVAASDIATVILPKKVADACGVELTGPKENTGRAYAACLDTMNFGMTKESSIESAREILLDYYCEYTGEKKGKVINTTENDLCVTTIVLPYKNVDDVSYFMDYIELAEKWRDVLHLQKARGNDLKVNTLDGAKGKIQRVP